MSNSTRRAHLPRPTTLALALAALSCLPAHAQVATSTSMPEVVVSASGFEQDIKQAPASITVLTREELSKERFGNLTQALESVEGIDVGAAGAVGHANS